MMSVHFMSTNECHWLASGNDVPDLRAQSRPEQQWGEGGWPTHPHHHRIGLSAVAAEI